MGNGLQCCFPRMQGLQMCGSGAGQLSLSPDARCVGVFDSLSLFASCVFSYAVLVASHASTSLIDAHTASILRTSHAVASIPSISTVCSSLILFPCSFASFASQMVTLFAFGLFLCFLIQMCCASFMYIRAQSTEGFPSVPFTHIVHWT